MHGPDPHAPAPADHGAAAATDPDWNAWLLGLLLFLAALTLLFTLSARHSSGENLAPEAAAPATAPAPRKPAPSMKATDDQRMADVLAALVGRGTADDSVPPQATADIEFVIRTVAESDNTFKLDGQPKTATDVSEWLLHRWQNAPEPVYSAEVLLQRTTGEHLVDLKLNRVVFPDGTEQALTEWLRNKLAEHNGTELPFAPAHPALPPPRTGHKSPK
jgi:hypothetical protein